MSLGPNWLQKKKHFSTESGVNNLQRSFHDCPNSTKSVCNPLVQGLSLSLETGVVGECLLHCCLYSQVYVWRTRVHIKLAVKYTSDTKVCVLVGVVNGLCLHPVGFPTVPSLHLLWFVLDPFFWGELFCVCGQPFWLLQGHSLVEPLCRKDQNLFTNNLLYSGPGYSLHDLNSLLPLWETHA